MRSTKRAALLGAAMTAIVPAIALANPDEGEVYLGVSLQALEGGLAEALDMKKDSGVLVSQVMPESPAEVAGLRLVRPSAARRLEDLDWGVPPDLPCRNVRHVYLRRPARAAG